MNKIIWIFLFIFFTVGAFSQSNLTGYEYWFNDDYAEKQSVVIAPGIQHQISTDFDASHLPDGLNRLTLRYKDENGLYSSTLTKVFLKHTLEKLINYEYWFNSDYGNKQVVDFTDSSLHETSVNIDVSDLPEGLNLFNIRYTGDNSFKGSVVTKVFIKNTLDKLVDYEYWFNNDYPNKQVISLIPDGQHQISEEIDVTLLPGGINLLNLRYKGNNGLYSSTLSRLFLKLPAEQQLTGYEFWFNNNYGNKKSTTITPAILHQIDDSIDASGLAEGLNTINLRYRHNSGVYSNTLTKFFYRNNGVFKTDKNLVSYEYWFNHQYNDRVTSAFVSAPRQELLTLIDASSLQEGLNLFNIRFKDETGIYSAHLTEYFYRLMLTNVEGNRITAVEYWFNNDYANRVLTHPDPSSTVDIVTNIDASLLSEGLNILHIRAKDEKGIYSATLSEFIYKNPLAGLNQNKIIAYRYMVEDENGNPVGGNPFTGYTDVRLETPISPALIEPGIKMHTLPKGNYTFHFSALDSTGQWSLTTTDPFEKTAFPIALFEMVNEHLCSGNSIQFDNLSFEADQYLWDFGDGNTSESFEPEHTYTVAGDYEVTLTATDTGTSRDSTYTVLITVNPEYTVVDRVSICRDSTYRFGTQNLTEAGEYVEVFQTAQGCDSTVTLTLRTIPGNTEIINHNFAIPGDTCFNSFYTLTVGGNGNPVHFGPGTTTTLIAGRSILLKPGLHAEPGCNLHAFITQDGTYCEDFNQAGSSLHPLIEKSIAEYNTMTKAKASFNKKTVRVYPNPNNGKFTVEMKNYEGLTKITLTNALGAVILRTEGYYDKALTIELPDRTKGLYFMQISNRMESQTIKLLVKQ
jgi:PKD repeat protein